jgi:hypothetical protein
MGPTILKATNVPSASPINMRAPVSPFPQARVRGLQADDGIEPSLLASSSMRWFSQEANGPLRIDSTPGETAVSY